MEGPAAEVTHCHSHLRVTWAGPGHLHSFKICQGYENSLCWEVRVCYCILGLAANPFHLHSAFSFQNTFHKTSLVDSHNNPVR